MALSHQIAEIKRSDVASKSYEVKQDLLRCLDSLLQTGHLTLEGYYIALEETGLAEIRDFERAESERIEEEKSEMWDNLTDREQ